MVKDPKDDIFEIVIGEDVKDGVKSIVVQVDENDLSTTVLSDYSPKDNIEFLIEAAGANAQELLRQGKNREELIKELKDFLDQVIDSYLDEDES